MITTTSETSHALPSNGKAYYIFYISRLIDNYHAIQNAYRSKYRNFTIAYSFKTNYLKEICDTIHGLGAFAEVVSPQEYEYAVRLGFSPYNIIYNGVIPDPVMKNVVATSGGIINIDNVHEFDEIQQIAHARDQKIVLGVRVNFPISNKLKSRFGIDIFSEEFDALMIRIMEDPLIEFGGFQCHIGQARPASYWGEKATIMAVLAQKYGAKYIDLGGGMYGPMPDELAKQFPDYTGSFDDYAKEVCSIMKRAFPDESVKLIIEPGTALVGNTMDLMTTITDIKQVAGKTYITVNAASNHLGVIADIKDLPVEVKEYNLDAGEARIVVEDAVIAGCTCLEFDYLARHYTGSVAIGDVMAFENVGAYSIGASRQFIVPRPAVYAEDMTTVLRPAEGYRDMFYLYNDQR